MRYILIPIKSFPQLHHNVHFPIRPAWLLQPCITKPTTQRPTPDSSILKPQNTNPFFKVPPETKTKPQLGTS